MYRMPRALDLSVTVGTCTTQLRVGQSDFQFTVGPVNFSVQSPIVLVRNGEAIGRWADGCWPDPAFLDIVNVDVVRCEFVSDRLLELEFDNGITMQLQDDSDQYESMQISVDGDPTLHVV